jgi:hypothetical protein
MSYGGFKIYIQKSVCIEIGRQVGLLEHHAKPWQLGALSPCLVRTLVIAFL